MEMTHCQAESPVGEINSHVYVFNFNTHTVFNVKEVSVFREEEKHFFKLFFYHNIFMTAMDY